MKKYFLTALVLAAGASLSRAQSFTDDFESYTAGAYLAQSNPTVWKTWENKPGTTQDVKISDAEAHSGVNSIYFTSVAGGPTDILLPFGNVYKSGKMAVDLWMFVDPGKVGYFNLQANAKAGEVWAADLNFKENGTYDVLNTTDGVLLSGTYTQNAWHHIKLDINLSTNSWELIIDDVSKGVFANSNMQVASMDIYAMANSSFYVDDVSYIYTPAAVMTLDAAVIDINNVNGLAGQAVTPAVVVRNLGSTNITGFDISVAYDGNTLNKQVTGVNIAPLATYTVTMDGLFTLAVGPHDMVATVSNVNGGADEDNTDDSKTLNINPIVPAQGKMVVGEEATGTWCGWCPRGAVFMDRMDARYSGLFIPIAVHNNDPMMDWYYDRAIGTRITGYPSMLVDRGPKIDPQAVESDLMKRIVVEPKGTMVNGASFAEPTATLKVSITTTFKEDLTGKYTLACVITEDDVKGTESKYAQANYYAGGGQGKMGGYESLPNPVPASSMVYNHVARAIIPHFSGASVFPSSITAGTKYTSTFTFDISGYNKDKIHIIGMLFGPDGITDNGSSVTLAEALANGLQSGTEVAGLIKFQGPDNALQVYPNPAKDIVYISTDANDATLTIIDMSGKEVISEKLGRKGPHQVSLSSLSEGLYMVRVVTPEKVYGTKVVVRR
jgi:archaellum component FlaF (FlaF/FlaG flagellin family)